MKKAQPVASTPAQFNAKKYVKVNLSEPEVSRIKESFDIFDVEGVGSINPKQLKLAMQALGFESTHHSVYQLICDYDADGKGSIGFEDFLHLMTHSVTGSDSKETIRKVFTLYDEDKTGYISIVNLRRLAKDINEEITEQQLQQMIEKADRDQDGRVSAEQFYAIVTRSFK